MCRYAMTNFQMSWAGFEVVAGGSEANVSHGTRVALRTPRAECVLGSTPSLLLGPRRGREAQDRRGMACSPKGSLVGEGEVEEIDRQARIEHMGISVRALTVRVRQGGSAPHLSAPALSSTGGR